MQGCVEQVTEESKMSKNPYELRFDLLQMAKDMLDKQYETNVSAYHTLLFNAAEQNKELYKDYIQYLPKMFTPEEIINQATKLQEFIDKK
jgi:hypothetical protein